MIPAGLVLFLLCAAIILAAWSLGARTELEKQRANTAAAVVIVAALSSGLHALIFGR